MLMTSPARLQLLEGRAVVPAIALERDGRALLRVRVIDRQGAGVAVGDRVLGLGRPGDQSEHQAG